MILEQRAGRGVSHHETVERGGDGKVATIRDARDPGAAETLRGARARFLGTGGGPERVPDLDGVPREVSAAWRRALFYEVPPDLPAPPPAPAPTGSALLEAARPVLERLAPAARQAGFRLLLADVACRVLWSSAAGEPYDLSEESVGHNSVAAALRTGRRAEVSGPEHVLEIWQETDALSVPVLERTGGHAVGAVTAVTAVRRLGPVETACAEAAALRRNEHILSRNRLPSNGDKALGRHQQTGNKPQQRGLAAAGRAEKRQRLPAVENEVDALEDAGIPIAQFEPGRGNGGNR